jgi:hypothetical protein
MLKTVFFIAVLAVVMLSVITLTSGGVVSYTCKMFIRSAPAIRLKAAGLSGVNWRRLTGMAVWQVTLLK